MNVLQVSPGSQSPHRFQGCLAEMMVPLIRAKIKHTQEGAFKSKIVVKIQTRNTSHWWLYASAGYTTADSEHFDFQNVTVSTSSPSVGLCQI